MFARWFCYTLIGCLVVSVIDAEEKDDDSGESPDYEVKMVVDVQPKSSVNTSINTLTTPAAVPPPVADSPFACFECTDCHTKSDRTIETCSAGIQQCFMVKKRVQNKDQIIRRGCSAKANHCSVAGDSNMSVGSVTCCEQHLCNRAMSQPSSLLMLSIFIFGSRLLMMMMSTDI